MTFHESTGIADGTHLHERVVGQRSERTSSTVTFAIKQVGNQCEGIGYDGEFRGLTLLYGFSGLNCCCNVTVEDAFRQIHYEVLNGTPSADGVKPTGELRHQGHITQALGKFGDGQAEHDEIATRTGFFHVLPHVEKTLRCAVRISVAVNAKASNGEMSPAERRASKECTLRRQQMIGSCSFVTAAISQSAEHAVSPSADEPGTHWLN
jgi:hypothetical protein